MKILNNRATTLASGISASSTTALLSAAVFPDMAAGSDYFYATLANSTETAWEVVKVTAVAAGTLAIERAQDGTTALDWGAGTRFELRPTAALLNDIANGKASTFARSTWAGTVLAYALTASTVSLGLLGRSGAGIGVYDSGFGVQDGSKTAFTIQTAEGQRTIDALGVWPVYTKPRTNLVLQSQTLGTTWSNGSSASVSSDAGTAPDGTATADKIVENSSSSTHYITQNIASLAQGTVYALSVYAKAGERNTVSLKLRDWAGAFKGAVFNLATGAVSGTSSGVRAYMVPVAGTAWYRCVIVVSSGYGATTPAFMLYLQDGSSYAGDGASGLYAWGAQAEAGTEATRYILTTTAAVTENPAYSSDGWNPIAAFKAGNPSDLGYIRPRSWEPARLAYTAARTNLHPASEKLALPAYSASARIIITTDATTAPDGVSLADKVAEDTSASLSHVLFCPGLTLTDNTTYTASVFVKAGERTKCRFIFRDKSNQERGVNVDLAAGTVTAQNSPISYSIVPSDGGWYRVTVTASSASGATTTRAVLYLQDAAGTISYTGDGTSGLYAWGFQVEIGSEATAYIPNLASYFTATIQGVTAPAEWDGGAAPAIYLTDWQGKRRLYSTPRTNYITIASDMSNGARWASASGGTGTPATCTAVAGAGPDGGTAYRLQANKGSGTTTTDASRWAHNNLTPPAGVRTISVWMKSNTGSPQLVAMEAQSGAVAICRVDSVWRKFALSFNYTGIAVQVPIIGTRGAYGSDDAIDILAAYPQWEDGAVATSWIPNAGTTDATVTDYSISGSIVTLASGGVSGGVLSWVGLQDAEAAHVATLPKASTVGAGKAFWITDEGGIVDGFRPLTVEAASGDTVNSGFGWKSTATRGRVCLISDGVSGWAAACELASTVDTFSTSETLTGKVWTTGKPIYRKVVAFGALPNTAAKSVAHGIVGATRILFITGTAFDPVAGNSITLPHAHWSGVQYSVMVNCDLTNLTITTGSDRSAYSADVVIEYIK